MVDLFWVVICYVISVIFLKIVVTEVGRFKIEVYLTLPPRLLNLQVSSFQNSSPRIFLGGREQLHILDLYVFSV